MRTSIAAKHFVVGLVLAAGLIAAGPAFAQSQIGGVGLTRPSFFGFGRIQCAAASDLCGWRRIPGGIWRPGHYWHPGDPSPRRGVRGHRR